MEKFTVEYELKSGLDSLYKNLKKDQIIQGRIIDCIEPNGYLLRIHGFNILTQSNGTFKKFDEIKLMVREVDSHLILDLIPQKIENKLSTNHNIDVIIS
jgi:hypothetical protein